jgi:hypothetical protein
LTGTARGLEATGLTPKGYAAAHRASLVRKSLNKSDRRIRLAAPACRAECSIGASRFESGDTHHEGPVVQLAEATGSKSVKSGFESQRGHQLAGRAWPNLCAPTTASYCERVESAPDEICAHSIPKRFKYLRKRSASFVVACGRVTR